MGFTGFIPENPQNLGMGIHLSKALGIIWGQGQSNFWGDFWENPRNLQKFNEIQIEDGDSHIRILSTLIYNLSVAQVLLEI